MATYVTDTHALVWYLTGSAELSSPARQVFRDTARGIHQILVPVIVVAELVMMIEKQRTSLNAGQIVTQLQQTGGYQVLPLTLPIALRIQAIPTIPDLHDRFIVATALANQSTLITCDAAITHSGVVPVIW